jgi:hypothetical protein
MTPVKLPRERMSLAYKAAVCHKNSLPVFIFLLATELGHVHSVDQQRGTDRRLAGLTVLAYFIGGISPNMDVANAALPAYVITLLFFVGLLIRAKDQPVWWHWCASPLFTPTNSFLRAWRISVACILHGSAKSSANPQT